MKTLIIGNNGYIGSLLFKKMKEMSLDVYGIDLCWFGDDIGNSIKKDMCNLTKDYLSEFELIICLAAHSSMPLCEYDPSGAIQNNVVNLINLIDKLRDNQKFIYASSASIYGKGTFDATETSMSYQLLNSYDTTKQIADNLVIDRINRGKNIVGLRFGTVCGISPNTRTDLVVNNMMLNAKLTNHIWVSNGTSRRSILAIDDAIGAIISIAYAFKSGIYNVKSFDSSIEDIALLVCKYTNSDYEIKPSIGNNYDFTISNELLTKQFAWTPSFTLESLVNNIAQYIGDIKENRRDSLPYGKKYQIQYN